MKFLDMTCSEKGWRNTRKKMEQELFSVMVVR